MLLKKECISYGCMKKIVHKDVICNRNPKITNMSSFSIYSDLAILAMNRDDDLFKYLIEIFLKLSIF